MGDYSGRRNILAAVAWSALPFVVPRNKRVVEVICNIVCI